MELAFVDAHESKRHEAYQYVYAEDWAGEGDIRIATIVREPIGFTVIWDGGFKPSPMLFPSYYMAALHVELSAPLYEEQVLNKQTLSEV